MITDMQSAFIVFFYFIIAWFAGVFGWPPTTDMVITSYVLKYNNLSNKYKKYIKKYDNLSLNSCCLTADRYQHEIEAKCVSQSKMAAKAWNDQASAINTRGTKTRRK